MRRHSFILRAAAVACPLVIAVAIVPSAVAKPKGKPKGPSVTCRAAITTEVPAGQTQVLPASPSGQQFGSVACGKLLGSGIEHTSFTIPASGDIQGAFWSYLGTGSVRGKFDITSQGGSLSTSPTSFTSDVYMGTVKIVGGTGSFAHAKGTGTETCKTANGLLFDCAARVKITKF